MGPGLSDTHLPARSLGLVVTAHAFGWIYFLAWTLSFYPQIIVNFKNRSTEGLSYDFATYNLIGFFSYCVYAIIRFITQQLYDLPRAVEVQDLCFAVHAFALCVVLTFQIALYDQAPKQRFSSVCIGSTAGCMILFGINSLLVVLGLEMITAHPHGERDQYWFSLWTLTEFAAMIKITVTLVKYLPQIHLNWQRKMTRGMAVWQFNLDAVGGVLSLSQNVIEAVNYNDKTYITGNYPKMIIGLIGLTYDAILLAQHYIIYRANNRGTNTLPTMSRKETTTQLSMMPSFELHYGSIGVISPTMNPTRTDTE